MPLSEAPAKGITGEKAKSPSPFVLTMFALTDGTPYLSGGDKVRASEQEAPRGDMAARGVCSGNSKGCVTSSGGSAGITSNVFGATQVISCWFCRTSQASLDLSSDSVSHTREAPKNGGFDRRIPTTTYRHGRGAP